MTLFAQELLHSVCVAPISFLGDYACAQMVHIKRRVRFALIMTLLHAGFQLLFGYANLMHLPYACVYNSVFQLSLYFLGPLIGSRDPVPRRLFAAGIIFATQSFASVFAETVYTLMGGVIDNTVAITASDPLAYFTMFLTCFLLVAAILPVVIFLWTRILHETSDNRLWDYLLFPVSQGVLLMIAIRYTDAGVFIPTRHIPLALAVLFCAVADALLFRSIRIHSRRAVDATRAEWYAHLLDQQKSYYDHILADQEDAAKIRHDIRNQLQAAYSLVDSGDREAARAQLDEIRATVDSAASYCENRVVNALLRVKAERFDAAGIAFDCRCRLPEGYPLRSTELCSLFSNVLDNAYRAASLCTDASPAVSLTCDVQGNALTLRCVNSCPPEDAPRESGHGLGLEILRDLAQRHNGAVTAERSGNTFTAMVQLLPDPVS